MRNYITRRDALRAMGCGGMGLLSGYPAGVWGGDKDSAGAKWYRGNLHMHSYWSDGRAFPEQAIDIYKKMGYDFISLTEHNLFADNPEQWKPVLEKEGGWPPPVTVPLFEAYKRDFPDGIDVRERNGKSEVRLKTYDEMCRLFAEPGKFLLLPGVEITQVIEGLNVHMNYINLRDAVPSVKGGPLSRKISDSSLSPSGVIRMNAAEVKQMASGMNQPSLLMLNHPQWVYWDITPQNLIENQEVRFFEVCNGGSSHAPHPDAPEMSNDTFWDAVNAFRSAEGVSLLYGIGTDDTHFYINRKPDQRIADAWVMVRSSDLTPNSLLAAMHAGDFYATTGVALEDVGFDTKQRTLHVRVRPTPGVRHSIRFITTKRGFDRTIRTLESLTEKKCPARKLPLFSSDIGKTVKVVEGTEGSYTMHSDDLYVRARIESDVPCGYKQHFHPDFQVAWTQPYC